MPLYSVLKKESTLAIYNSRCTFTLVDVASLAHRYITFHSIDIVNRREEELRGGASPGDEDVHDEKEEWGAGEHKGMLPLQEEGEEEYTPSANNTPNDSEEDVGEEEEEEEVVTG